MRLMMVTGLWLLVLSGLAAAPAGAGRLSEFHTAFADAWGHYRQVAFHVGRGGEAVAAIELDEFVSKWTALAATYRSDPPAAFADDDSWGRTLDDIGSRAKAGLERLDGGDIDGAKEQLLPIRGIAGDLRRRNGVVIHADSIDELSAAMDVLAGYRRDFKELDDPAIIETVTRQAAIVAYLFEKCDRLAPPAIAEDPEFRRQVDGAKESMDKLWQALRSGDVRLFRIGIGEARSYERILFFRFG